MDAVKLHMDELWKQDMAKQPAYVQKALLGSEEGRTNFDQTKGVESLNKESETAS